MQKGFNACTYFKGKDFGTKNMPWEPLDIEELHETGKSMNACPYYVMKDRAGAADVVFMPYSYIIDQKYRENFAINWENSVIIFDEAHNVPQCCEDSASFSIDSDTLEKINAELIEF